MTKLLLITLLLAALVAGKETGPDPRYTAAPGDDPKACSSGMCHTNLPDGGPINAYGGGVNATFSTGSSYTPGGGPITIVVSVSDPVNTHFGFQMTARLESDLVNGQAGSFTPGTTPGCPAISAPCEIVICDDGSVFFKKCPANPATGGPGVQFIEHAYAKGSQVSTLPYSFTWTPPATNVGPVHFYVAGNAVNGDLNQDGSDHVYTAEFTLTPVLCSGATPTVGAVVSASAFGELASITAGSWIEIYGSNFASGTWEWAAPDFNGLTAPSTLAGINVSIGGKPAYMYFIYHGPTYDQVDVQAPADGMLGQVPVMVSSCGKTSPPFSVQQDAVAPGLLAPSNYLVNGKQYLAAQFNSDGTLVGDPSIIPGTVRPAKPGDLIVVYGNGFGGVQTSSGATFAPGAVVTDQNTLTNPFTFSFGSISVSPQYDGLAPGAVGLYQFNIPVPKGLPNGDILINVTLNGVPLGQKLFLTIKN